MRGIVLVGLLAGCYDPHPSAGVPCGDGAACPTGLTCTAGTCEDHVALDGPAIDAPPDAPGIDACSTFSSLLDTCMLPPATGPFTASSVLTYDTDAGTLNGQPAMNHVHVQTATGMVDVVYVTALTVNANRKVRIIGSLPIAIVARGPVAIYGSIDVSDGAAGARSAQACGISAGGNGVAHATGGPGGGGGAFRGNGGRGGMADLDASPIAGGTAGVAIPQPAGLRGGCPGGNGGDGSAAGSGAAGDTGGGAVYIVSASSIMLAPGGSIVAGGGGGNGGLIGGGGGGGGGSGGMILLEAPSMTIGGILEANGGGGGGGGGATTAGGAGAQTFATSNQAAGGPGGDTGGNGGNGAAGPMIPGATAPGAQDGSGAGGGGAGYISIRSGSAMITGLVTPSLTPFP